MTEVDIALDKDGSYDFKILFGDTVDVTKLDTCSIKNDFTLQLSESSIASRKSDTDPYYESIFFVFDKKHEHNWSKSWSVDKNAHWHECKEEDCDIINNNEKDGYGAHTYGSWSVTKEATATTKGVKTRKCTVCGYEEKGIIPATGATDEGTIKGEKSGNKDSDGKTTDSSESTAPTEGDTLTDSVTNGEYTVTSDGTANGTVTYSAPAKKSVTSVTVPDTVKIKGKKYKVTAIKANAFKNNKKLKKITIGKNIKAIGKKAVVKVPKKKKKAYKKILKKRGINGKKQKIR